MKSLMNLILLLLLSWSARGQTGGEVIIFGGCVTDINGQLIDYATILLQQNDQQQAGTITGKDGCFSIETRPGNYTLFIQCLGYDSIRTDVSLPLQKLISDNGERFVFENCTRLHFDSSIDTDKIGYSDMLFM